MRQGDYTHRLAAVLLLGVLLLGAYALLVRPYLGHYRSLQAELTALETELAELRLSASRRASVERQLAAADTYLNQDRHYLRAAVPALAAAELQHHVGRLIARHRGQVLSIQSLVPEEGDGSPPRVGLRVRFRGDVEAVQRALYDFYASSPVVSVERLEIRHLGPGYSVRSTASAAAPLSVAVELSGFIREDSP